MDVPSPVDRALPDAPPTPATPDEGPDATGGGSRPLPAAGDDDINVRLARVERQMAEIGARLDRLAAAVPETLRVVVAEQVDEVAADLRHTVSDLGRLLLRDLGRLTQVLAEHREQIVADLRNLPPAAVRPAPAEPDSGESPDAALPSVVPAAVETDDTSEMAKRRRGSHLLKRREG